MRIEWTGDLDDDCFAQVGELSAHVEALGEVQIAELDDDGKPSRRERWYTAYWHIGVYRHRGKELLYDSSEHGGLITGDGAQARAIAEAVMRAAQATEGKVG